MGKIIGIDLGTTNSCVACQASGHHEPEAHGVLHQAFHG